MDTSTIEMLLGFTDLQVEAVEIQPARIIVRCQARFDQATCPLCLKKCNRIQQTQTRIVRDLPVFGKEVYLHLQTRQFHCPDCQRFFYERFAFVEPNRTMTTRLEKYLYECCRHSCFQQVAARENVGWDTLQHLFSRWAHTHIKEELNTLPTRLGIDEFAYRKGKKDYAVVLVDLDRSVVWDVLPRRDKESLKAYFQAKGSTFCTNLLIFSCDMWPGFSGVATELFPNAAIIVDRFHLFTHLHAELDVARRKLRQKFPKEISFKAIKWLLYQAWENLSMSHRRTLLTAFRLCAGLRDLYFLKNELRNIFEADVSQVQADSLLVAWMEQARQHTVEGLDKFVTMLQTWKKHILPFFSTRHSNGIVEGINNAIKTLKRGAYGFRNFEQFRERILVNFLQPL